MTDGPRTVAVVAERRHLANEVLREATATLEALDVLVALIVPDADQAFAVPTERPPWDAVVSRGRDLAGLGIFAAAAALGVPAINDPRSIDLVRNKIAMQAVLLEHGLPLPATWFAADVEVFRSFPHDRFPLVVKPFDGDGSRGLALITRPGDVDLLAPIEARRTLYLAQEFLETDGWDLKLYGIGSEVWGVRKASPVSFPGAGPAHIDHPADAELVTLDPALRDIGLTCGRACGLELWGVDVALTPHGPRVIEVNDFPTYSAVPGAGAAIAEHIVMRIDMDRVARRTGRERTLAIVRDGP